MIVGLGEVGGSMALSPDHEVSMKTLLLQEAAEYCKDVYNDYTEHEIMSMSPSIQNCWDIGFKLVKEGL